jgi:ribosomal protein RSM22 (predicted rRNA methylase)
LRYEGYEGVRPWQRVTQDIIASAKQLSSAKQIPTDPILAALDRMKISFQPVVQVSDLNDSSKSSASKTKLVLCNHYLSALRSDAARSDFVNSLWVRHPDAEVLAFVEEGSQRGFACIASAREELLGIGRRSAAAKEAGQDGVTADLVGHQACYVVAPCPHDRPCPLLHDFELDATVNSSLGKTVQSSSPMFHGASTGLVTCTSPLRVQNPTYTRLTRGTARANDFVQHSYLIVRRGDRPSFKSAAQSMAQSADQALSIFSTLQEQAAKTKEGIIDALRQSRSTVRDIPLAEIVSEEGQSVDPEDKDAQAELLRMLPDILRQQQGLDMTSNEQDIEHATRLAQNIMEQSADLAAAAQTEPSEQERMEADSVNLSAALLDQQRSMDSTEEEGLGDPSPVEGLSTEELQSMRTESFEWPRLVRTPMKKGGHVIFDACTAQASIDRFTLTRSMGRQTYQDARKAAHGDLLPYVPLTEQPTFTEDTSSDQADNFQTTTHIQNVKALINSVPAADVSRRNAMPPSAKISRSAGRRASIKRQFPWPASSAQAIGADLIAGGEAESDVESTGTALARRSTADSFTRRTHYKDGKGRGAEQLRSANVYTPRENRKRSMESYGEEALQGWTMPDEGVQEHDQEPPEKEVFRS